MTVPLTSYKVSDIATELNQSTANISISNLHNSTEIDDSDDIPNAINAADLKAVPNVLNKFRGYVNNAPLDVFSDLYFVYELNESSGTLLTDAAGITLGYISTVDFTQNLTGKLGKCVLNNSDSGAFISDPQALSSDSYTISTWLKGVPSKVSLEYIWRFFTTGENLRAITSLDGTQVTFRHTFYTGSVYAFHDYTVTVNMANWTHVVVVRTNNIIALYVNGTLISTGQTTLPVININSVRFGDVPLAEDAYTHYYDQCAMWLRGLNASEVSYINNNGNGIEYINW